MEFFRQKFSEMFSKGKSEPQKPVVASQDTSPAAKLVQQKATQPKEPAGKEFLNEENIAKIKELSSKLTEKYGDYAADATYPCGIVLEIIRAIEENVNSVKEMINPVGRFNLDSLDFEAALIRPFKFDLASRDDVKRDPDYIKLGNMLLKIREEILKTLKEKYDFEEIKIPLGQKVKTCEEYNVTSSVVTNDPAMRGTIAGVITPGYKEKGKIIQRPNVEVYRIS